MTTDVPEPAQVILRAIDKPALRQRIGQRLQRLWTWLDRIDPARLIGGSDVYK